MVIRMGRNDFLGQFEQSVMLAILRLRSDAYGVKIRKEIEERIDQSVSYGALYTTLDRLETKGFISSWQGDPTPERGGRAKKYFQVEAKGQLALDQAREIHESMWDGLVPARA